ncbi:MAG: hypothetical protein GXO44_04130 [Deferribacteres bacterium]|nr:hypothetical protein [Deferribacteres bacterium]
MVIRKDRIKPLVFCLFLFVFTLSDARSASIKNYDSLYFTYINYVGSEIKKSGTAFTLYGFLGDAFDRHLFEYSLMQYKIDYKNGLNDLDQTDLTLAYTNMGSLLKNLYLRAGLHYIWSDDHITRRGKTYFADVSYVVLGSHNFGLEGDYSRYNNLFDLDVFQLSPHGGFFFDALGRNFYVELRGYYIHLDYINFHKLSIKDYYSAELSLSHRLWKDFVVKVSGWVGQQIFAVKRWGFVVYNLPEVYKGGVSLETSYSYKRIKAGIEFFWNSYKELMTRNDVNQYVVNIFVGFRF